VQSKWKVLVRGTYRNIGGVVGAHVFGEAGREVLRRRRTIYSLQTGAQAATTLKSTAVGPAVVVHTCVLEMGDITQSVNCDAHSRRNDERFGILIRNTIGNGFTCHFHRKK
jgi:hypothetical protein